MSNAFLANQLEFLCYSIVDVKVHGVSDMELWFKQEEKNIKFFKIIYLILPYNRMRSSLPINGTLVQVFAM